MVNVPTGVWIDEKGRIVRPPEVAYSRQMSFLGQTLGDDRYAAGLRDWIDKGAASRYAMSAEELAECLARGKPERLLADAQFALGTYFQHAKDAASARTHFEAAQKLAPLNWNYHRQAWLFEGVAGQFKFLDKVRKLDGPYYPPARLPDRRP